MKLIIDILKAIVLSFVISVIVLFLTKNNDIRCSALDAFSGESSIQTYFSFLGTLIIALVIWIAGLILYFLIRKKKQINLFFFFSILTVLSLHSFVFEAITKSPEENRKIKEVICNKSSDDGMQLNFNKLNKAEYNFINLKTNWLPSIPESSKSININYIRDDFFGEFDLTIELTLFSDEKLDTLAFPKWTLNGYRYIYKEGTSP